MSVKLKAAIWPTTIVGAEKLLRETNLNISEIAYLCGFRNHVHFVRRFREIKTISPGRDRNQFLNGLKRV